MIDTTTFARIEVPFHCQEDCRSLAEVRVTITPTFIKLVCERHAVRFYDYVASPRCPYCAQADAEPSTHISSGRCADVDADIIE